MACFVFQGGKFFVTTPQKLQTNRTEWRDTKMRKQPLIPTFAESI